jgi:hypothetical protein
MRRLLRSQIEQDLTRVKGGVKGSHCGGGNGSQ